jgi:peptide/nickel transport system substrate-binding protein
VDFVILGAVGVRSDGQAVALGGRKQRAVLAQLLLRPNEVVPRHELIDGLWGERPPASASRTLDSHVSRLRATLGADRIERREPGFVVRLEPDELDAARFEQLLGVGRSRLSAGDPSAAVDRFDAALSLWRGHALADLLDEPFGRTAGEHLEERRLLCREERFDALLSLGRDSELVGELETCVAEHPFRERFLGQLMLALYRSGRQAEALAAYQRGRRLLATELGLEPGPQLRELERRILEHDPGLLPVSREVVTPTQRTTRLAALGVAAALACIAAAAAVVFVLDRGDSPALAKTSSSTLVEISSSAKVLGRPAALPDAPAAAATGAGSVWLAEPDTGEVVRVDESSGNVERIPVGGSPGAIAFGGGAAWVVSVGGSTVYRIDPATDTVSGSVPLGTAHADAIAYGLGELWVADSTDDDVLRVDPHDDLVTKPYTLAVHPTALAIGAGGLWVADYLAGTATDVDPRTGLVIGTVHVGAGPTQIVIADGYVWVANSGDNTVSKIDPTSDTETRIVPVGQNPEALATTDGTVWVANQYSEDVSSVNALTDRVTRDVAVGGGPTSLAAVGSTLWIGTRPVVRHRGGTLILLHTRALEIDPAMNLDVPPFQADGLTRDPLVTYNHVGGEQGSLLVPDLASRLPTLSPDGTIYTFHLRKGIRYSDGRYVHASDVRREIERVFRLQSGGVAFFSDIVGARACDRSRCDLSRGIVADDSALTLSFHLVRPNPDFLTNLTIGGLATPVPPGTPWHDVGYKPIPATGPYEIAHASKGDVVYVRNPYFHQWSHSAQPAGNPDRVVMRFGHSQTEEAEMVARGAADWTDDGVPAALLPRFEARHRAQLHIFPQTETDFMTLNTRVAPFDDVRVRQALNLAVDRSAVARLYGGREFATPTCQLLPPGLLGYHHFCPYTTSLVRARRLVAESHTRGERVVVWGLNDGSGLALAVPYVVHVLRRLGYRASSHLVSDYPAGQLAYRTIQIAATGDLDNSPGNFFETWAACNSAAAHGWACDPAVDRTIQKDAALEASDPRAADARWAKLDRELMKRSDWLPLVNQQAVDFVSARVAGYEYNPEPGLRVVADQLWIR